MKLDESLPGRLIKAPENFLSRVDIRTVVDEAKQGRRGFIRNAFAAVAAGAAASSVLAPSSPVSATGGDENILDLPEHSKGLGQSVAFDGGYGKP